MQVLAKAVYALGCGAALGLGTVLGTAPARAQQSYFYPPEVRARPVVAVLDPYLQRHYWDPRYCDVYGMPPPRRWRCRPDGGMR
jgi:hypothetical protein